MSEIKKGHYLEDKIIFISGNVTTELLEKYSIPPPLGVDLSQYKLIKIVYAGVESFPALIEK